MTSVEAKPGTRGGCVQCQRTLLIRARGLCCTCYRYRNGRPEIIARAIDPTRRAPREFASFTDMFAKVGPTTRLRRHERAAFADVHRVWSRR